MESFVGILHRESMIVGDDTAISFLGHSGARVLGTPWMILWMERTSRNAVKPHLPDGWDTVGTVVNIRHLAAAPMGAEVLFEAEVVEETKSRLLFRVSAVWNGKTIGDGMHERAKIDVNRFAERLQSTQL